MGEDWRSFRGRRFCLTAGPAFPDRALAYAVATDRQLRVTGCAVPGKIAGYCFFPFHADDGAAADFGDHVVRDYGGAGARRHGNRDDEFGAANHIRRDGDIAQVGAPAGGDPGIRRVLDDIAGHHCVGFDADADAGAVVRIGTGRAVTDEVADEIALDDGEPASLVEVRDRHAKRRAVDNVVRRRAGALPRVRQVDVLPDRSVHQADAQIGRRHLRAPP
jgi:hypothetical protein